MSTIWRREFTLSEIESSFQNTILQHLQINLVELGTNFLSATMPVDERTVQPMRLLHGGASCVLAESLGSLGTHLIINPDQYFAVGLNISMTHLKSVSEKKGQKVLGVSTLKKQGQTLHLWENNIYDEEKNLISFGTLSVLIREKR